MSSPSDAVLIDILKYDQQQTPNQITNFVVCFRSSSEAHRAGDSGPFPTQDHLHNMSMLLRVRRTIVSRSKFEMLEELQKYCLSGVHGMTTFKDMFQKVRVLTWRPLPGKSQNDTVRGIPGVSITS